jgi:hypothetical protein
MDRLKRFVGAQQGERLKTATLLKCGVPTADDGNGSAEEPFGCM